MPESTPEPNAAKVEASPAPAAPPTAVPAAAPPAVSNAAPLSEVQLAQEAHAKAQAALHEKRRLLQAANLATAKATQETIDNCKTAARAAWNAHAGALRDFQAAVKTLGNAMKRADGK